MLALVPTLMGIFGEGNEPQYQQPQIPQWMQDAYQQTWGEISAPAQ